MGEFPNDHNNPALVRRLFLRARAIALPLAVITAVSLPGGWALAKVEAKVGHINDKLARSLIRQMGTGQINPVPFRKPGF